MREVGSAALALVMCMLAACSSDAPRSDGSSTTSRSSTPRTGVSSTPVVDVSASRVYLVGMVQPGRHVLFALDMMTGRLVASVPADARGADPAVQNQRGALSLSQGRIFVPYGGRFGDCGDYRGRLVSVGVSGNGLGNPATYTLPTEREGGFWAPPGAVIANDGSLFLASGNSSSSLVYDYGNSVVH